MRPELVAWLRNKIQTDVIIMRDTDTVVGENGAPAAWMFDFRRVFLNPEFAENIGEAIWATIQRLQPTKVGGMESAALPLIAGATSRARLLGAETSGFFIRKSRKPTGRQKLIEGEVNSDDSVVLVDDLMNTGRSILRQVDVLLAEGIRVKAVCVIVSFHDTDWYTELAARNVEVISIFSLSDFPSIEHKIPSSAPTPMSFEVIWKFGIQAPNLFYIIPKSAPVLDEKYVYFGADDGTFRALDKHTGHVVWEFKIPYGIDGKYIFSSAAIHNGVVFFGAYDGCVYALECLTGTLVWKNQDAEWVGSSPALAPEKGILYIGFEHGLWGRHGAIVALDIRTGERKWVCEVVGTVHATPAYSMKFNLVMCGSNDGTVRALDADTGAPLWSVYTRGEVKASIALDDENGIAVFGSLDGNVYLVDLHNPASVTSVEFKAGIYSTPLIHGNLAYVGCLDRHIYAIDLKEGTVVWKAETGGRVFASPVLFENELYSGSNDGWLYILDPVTGEKKGCAHTTERIVNAIAIDTIERRFYVPTQACEIYCLRRKI